MARPRMMVARRRKEWAALPGNNIDMTASGTSLGSSIAFTLGGQTVLRMMGEYAIIPTSAPTIGDRVTVTVAIGVVSTDAFNVGATAVPDPSGEPGYPWLYWASHPFRFAAATIDPRTAASELRHSFDVKSQRKLSIGQSLAMIVEYADLSGNPSLSLVVGSTRVLLALS